MPISSWEISQESCKAFSKKNVKMSPKGRPPTCSAPGSPCCRLQNWFNPCLGSGGEGLLPKVLRGGMDPPTSGSGRALACGHQQPPCLTKQKASMGKIRRGNRKNQRGGEMVGRRGHEETSRGPGKDRNPSWREQALKHVMALMRAWGHSLHAGRLLKMSHPKERTSLEVSCPSLGLTGGRQAPDVSILSLRARNSERLSAIAQCQVSPVTSCRLWNSLWREKDPLLVLEADNITFLPSQPLPLNYSDFSIVSTHLRERWHLQTLTLPKSLKTTNAPYGICPSLGP